MRKGLLIIALMKFHLHEKSKPTKEDSVHMWQPLVCTATGWIYEMLDYKGIWGSISSVSHYVLWLLFLL